LRFDRGQHDKTVFKDFNRSKVPLTEESFMYEVRIMNEAEVVCCFKQIYFVTLKQEIMTFLKSYPDTIVIFSDCLLCNFFLFFIYFFDWLISGGSSKNSRGGALDSWQRHFGR